MQKLILLLSLLVVACATPNTGVVAIGNGNYMLSKMGGFTQYSGGEVKAELYKEAAAFCAKSAKQVVPGPSTSSDAGVAKYSSAEIQFRCE
jgi:hypothetical protein